MNGVCDDQPHVDQSLVLEDLKPAGRQSILILSDSIAALDESLNGG